MDTSPVSLAPMSVLVITSPSANKCLFNEWKIGNVGHVIFFSCYYSDLDNFIFSFIKKPHFIQSSDSIKLQNQITDPVLWSSREPIRANVIILTPPGT